jgi:hypothetical protein
MVGSLPRVERAQFRVGPYEVLDLTESPVFEHLRPLLDHEDENRNICSATFMSCVEEMTVARLTQFEDGLAQRDGR